jgi:hypothetical protein
LKTSRACQPGSSGQVPLRALRGSDPLAVMAQEKFLRRADGSLSTGITNNLEPC